MKKTNKQNFLESEGSFNKLRLGFEDEYFDVVLGLRTSTL